MKKKIIASLIALTLMMAMILPVSADRKQETTLAITVDSTYTLSIPISQSEDQPLSIGFGTTKTTLYQPLAITGTIRSDEKVVVSVEKTEFTSSEENVISYTLTSDGEDFEIAEWDEEDLHRGEKIYPLEVNISEEEWEAAPAGDYQSVIIFTSKIETKTS